MISFSVISLSSVLDTLFQTPLATAIREGTIWFPWLESIHVLAATLVFGTIATVDLHLLGLETYRAGIARVIRQLVPWTWGGFGLALATGSALFIAKAPTYAGNTFFQWKMAALLAAGLNMLAFHFGPLRRIATWGTARPYPRVARLAGGLSLLLWVAVVCCGRGIGFTLSPF